MQAKGLIKFFAIALAIVCLFQLSFTLKGYFVNKAATNHAEDMRGGWESQGLSADTVDYRVNRAKQSYLNELTHDKSTFLGMYSYSDVRDRQLNLGLDLQGGMSVILEVSIEDMLLNLAGLQKIDPDFQAALARAKENEANSSAAFVEGFINAWKEIAGEKSMASIFSNVENDDLVELNMTNEQVAEVLNEQASASVDRTLKVLESRIDQFGVASPNIKRIEGTDRIMVELPGADDPERVRKILQSTAVLEFWNTKFLGEVYDELNDIDRFVAAQKQDKTSTEEVSDATVDGDMADATDATDAPDLTLEDTDTTAGATPVAQGFDPDRNPFMNMLGYNDTEENGIYGGRPVIGVVQAEDTAEVREILQMPEVIELLGDVSIMWDVKNNFPVGKDAEITSGYRLYAIERTAGSTTPRMDGGVVVNARSDRNPATNELIVTLGMNSEGSEIWDEWTAKNAQDNNRAIAITLDKKVYSAPNVNERISGGRTQISGNFNQADADDLASILRAGKLPTPAKIIQESQVGPTLGQASIRAGVMALLAGMILVLVFMVIYYAKAGIVADIALLINVFFIFGVLASIGAVLTLPGIAGIVLTIGMAVDANVIIFERIREEILKGKGMRLALIDGYKHSISAIIDANVTTAITAIILAVFGMGPVVGFATVLIIGICSSLFTAVLLTRLMFERSISKEKEISMGSKATLNAFSKLNLNVINKRKIAYAISSVVIVAGIISMFTRGQELGVDFEGGRSYQIEVVGDNVNESAIRQALTPVFENKTPEVKSVASIGASKTYKVTTAYKIDTKGEEADAMVLAALYTGMEPFIGGVSKDDFVTKNIQEYNKVGPTIADDIRKNALIGTFFALLGIFLYILIRFRKWQYSVGAIAALMHDVLIVLGLFSLLHGILPFSMEINQAFIAAILTVIGYSINDTVVVFDRVREHLGMRKKGTLLATINDAINKTFSRTMITSVTTLVVILALLIAGGDNIKGFAFAIFIGILVGTYSSIFIATPVMADLSLKKAIEEEAKEAVKADKRARKKKANA